MSSKTSASTGAGPTGQQAAVRSGAIGQSGIGGGYSTPDLSFLNPQQSAALNQNTGTDWLKALFSMGGQSSANRARAQLQGAAAFREAPMAQGSHNIDIGKLISAYFGGQ